MLAWVGLFGGGADGSTGAGTRRNALMRLELQGEAEGSEVHPAGWTLERQLLGEMNMAWLWLVDVLWKMTCGTPMQVA